MPLTPARARSLRTAASWLGRALVVAAAVAWFVLLRPEALGGTAGYIIVSGTSMEPLLHEGDLAVVVRQDGYAVGDVVTYRVPDGDVAAGAQVIHRVVAGSGSEGYVMQGDNTNGPDFWRPTDGDVVGRLTLFIPDVGLVLSLFRQPLLLASFLAGTAVFYLMLAPPRALPNVGAVEGVTVRRRAAWRPQR